MMMDRRQFVKLVNDTFAREGLAAASTLREKLLASGFVNLDLDRSSPVQLSEIVDDVLASILSAIEVERS